MKPWYQDACQHMWRFYFACTDASCLSGASKLQYEACSIAISRFSRLERDILRFYFTTNNGGDTVRECSAHYDISPHKIFNTIKSANRAVAEERGLIDRRDV